MDKYNWKLYQLFRLYNVRYLGNHEGKYVKMIFNCLKLLSHICLERQWTPPKKKNSCRLFLNTESYCLCILYHLSSLSLQNLNRIGGAMIIISRPPSRNLTRNLRNTSRSCIHCTAVFGRTGRETKQENGVRKRTGMKNNRMRTVGRKKGIKSKNGRKENRQERNDESWRTVKLTRKKRVERKITKEKMGTKIGTQLRIN